MTTDQVPDEEGFFTATEEQVVVKFRSVPDAELIRILVRVGSHRGIILELLEDGLYHRDEPKYLFPAHFVYGAMLGSAIEEEQRQHEKTARCLSSSQDRVALLETIVLKQNTGQMLSPEEKSEIDILIRHDVDEEDDGGV